MIQKIGIKNLDFEFSRKIWFVAGALDWGTYSVRLSNIWQHKKNTLISCGWVHNRNRKQNNYMSSNTAENYENTQSVEKSLDSSSKKQIVAFN